MDIKIQGTDILLCGNTAYFSKEDIEAFAGDRRVAVVGESGEHSVSGRICRYKSPLTAGSLSKLFQAYDFGTLIYISGYLTFGEEPEKEVGDLRGLLHECRAHGLAEGIILLPQDVLGGRNTSRKLTLSFLENLCQYYAEGPMKVRVVRCPYPASGSTGYFHDLIAALEEGQNLTFPRPFGERTNFILQRDLDAFLARLLDKPLTQQYGVMDLRGYQKYTFGEAADLLKKQYPGSRITCTGGDIEVLSFSGEDTARRELGWFAAGDVFDHFDDLVGAYRKTPERKKSKREKVLEKFRHGSRLVTTAEVIVGAALMEFLNHVLQNSVQFRMIDVRLLYVVLISSVYGLGTGLAASILACISLAYAYRTRGIGILMLFYQPDNWLPFILYLTAAAVCGLVRDRHAEETQKLSGNIEELKEENDYTGQLYDEAVSNKNEYRRNLVRSRDGFGRIFEVVQKLVGKDPSEIYGEAVNVMEDVLDNDSVAIYSIAENNGAFARLEISSARLTPVLQKSIRLADYVKIMPDILEGKVYVNREGDKNLPVYAAGVLSGTKLRIMIFLWEAQYDQMSSYYENLIRVLCGLIQSFMLEAWSYERATKEQSHIKGTSLVKPEVFKKELENRRKLAGRSQMSYCVIRIKGGGRSAEQMEETLHGHIRAEDLVTADEKSGDYYVLAMQMSGRAQSIVLGRLQKLGLDCDAVEAG